MDAQFCGELARTRGATASTSQSLRSTINVRVQPTPGVIISLESSTQSLNAASSVLGATLQRRAALDASTVSPLRLGLPYILVRGVVAQRHMASATDAVIVDSLTRPRNEPLCSSWKFLE
ncbi:hypothetical protein HPB50_002871 [Hyalomma asiaticum]|uniref:Uncharacterized protein n=1 Tax=Hyalomma asiaticum TaxID=266040 RepID=A0ACB7SHH0_HYAAI|nr:hypothetical protein HPB50_002871 [Hyalomma asiaticum]